MTKAPERVLDRVVLHLGDGLQQVVDPADVYYLEAYGTPNLSTTKWYSFQGLGQLGHDSGRGPDTVRLTRASLKHLPSKPHAEALKWRWDPWSKDKRTWCPVSDLVQNTLESNPRSNSLASSVGGGTNGTDEGVW